MKIILILLLLAPLAYACNDNYCEANLSVSTDKNLYNNQEKITIYNNLDILENNKSIKKDFIIEYWVEYNNTIIKDKTNTTNLNPKSYTPNLKNTEKIKIKNRLVFIDCNNTNTIIESEKEVEIYVYKSEVPFIEIKKLYLGSDNKVKLNDTIKVKFNAYNGNSSEILKIEIKNITNITYLLSPKYESFNLTEYLTVPDNCNISSANYTLDLTYLNLTKSENVEIINTCKIIEINLTEQVEKPKEEKVTNKSNKNTLKNSESNINSSQITGNAIYSSSSLKSKELGLYLLIAIAVMASMYIVPKINKNGIPNKSNIRSNRISRRARKQSI